MRLVKRFAVLVGRCHYVGNDGLYNYCGVSKPKSKKTTLLKNPKPLLPSAHFSTTVSNKEIENSSR